MAKDSIKYNLQKYLNVRKPLGQRSIFEITQLTDGKSSNLLNYKVVTSDGIFVARIMKPEDWLNYTNLADEYSILKLVESYGVSPNAFMIDLEYFQYPILLEEYIEGVAYDQILQGTEEMFDALIGLIVRISEIKLEQQQFPFKFTYTTYMTNFRAWNLRMKEIDGVLGVSNNFSGVYREVIKVATKYLEDIDLVLRSAKREFIYNDVHPGNTFWLPQTKEAKFIDWQKVSLGDPAFMAALFARRFSPIFQMNAQDFAQKVLISYGKHKNIQNFETLFQARIIERAVSDMIWEMWAAIKSGLPIKIQSPEESKYYNEAKECFKRLQN